MSLAIQHFVTASLNLSCNRICSAINRREAKMGLLLVLHRHNNHSLASDVRRANATEVHFSTLGGD